MYFVLWYFRLWVLSEPNLNLNRYSLESETFKILNMSNMISISNMYPKYNKYYWTSKIIIYYMNVDGWRWRLKLEIFRFWFCFYWITFSFHDNLIFVLCFHLFGFLSINNYVYFSFGFELSRLMFISYFWIDFTYILITK